MVLHNGLGWASSVTPCRQPSSLHHGSFPNQYTHGMVYNSPGVESCEYPVQSLWPGHMRMRKTEWTEGRMCHRVWWLFPSPPFNVGRTPETATRNVSQQIRLYGQKWQHARIWRLGLVYWDARYIIHPEAAPRAPCLVGLCSDWVPIWKRLKQEH